MESLPSENLIYTAEFENWRTQKFVLHPEKAKTSSSGRPSPLRRQSLEEDVIMPERLFFGATALFIAVAG